MATYVKTITVNNGRITAISKDNPSLSSDITGTLPIANGGTGQTTAGAAYDALTVKGADVASASTTNIGAATGSFIHITGTTTITAFDSANAGVRRIVVFDGILILTHNATTLILPTGANITTAADDTAVFLSEGSGNWRCTEYVRKDGSPLSSLSNPMTTLGDTIYGGASGLPTRLPGNTTTDRKFLGQTGDGANSAAPAWDRIVETDLALTDVTSKNATAFLHGFLPKLSNILANRLNGQGGWTTVTDAELSVSDVTSNNASTSAHGFLKKLDNSADSFMNGQGNWAIPAGSGVTSFSAGNLSPLFTSSVVTATTTPALTFSLSSANANRVLAGPTTGAAAAPTYRALVDADIPTTLYKLINKQGTYSSRPSSGWIEGRTYKCTDGLGYELYDNGSSWTYYHRGIKVREPNNDVWTWDNQDSASSVTTYGGIQLTRAAYASVAKINVIHTPCPTAPYTTGVIIGIVPIPATYYYGGILVGWGDGTKYVMLEFIQGDGATVSIFNRVGWTNSTTLAGRVALSYGLMCNLNGPIFVKLNDDNTNLIWSLSHDRKTWWEITSYGRTAFTAAPTKIAIGMYPYDHQTGVWIFDKEDT